MVKLKCQRCGNIWEYKGKNPYRANCSFCGSQVSIKKHTVFKKHSENILNFTKPDDIL